MVNRVGRPRNLNKIGVKHGRLTIVKDTYSDGLPAWECLCECGTQHVVKDRDLTSTKSCGCLRIDLGKANKTHGMTLTPTYQVWHAMKQRCLNPKHRAWKNYGGRGVTVCQTWIDSFDAFLSDMGEKPNGCSLDRIDNDGNYCPSNCRWATSTIQANNRRTNVHFNFKGKDMTLSELARLSGKSIQTLSWRIYKLNMSVEEAVTTNPLRTRKER
jgi:hypothetical protein